MRNQTTKILLSVLLGAFLFLGVDCKDDKPCLTCPTPVDTTSHDFEWTIDTIGDGGNGVFYDVTIINDTLAYAVGELYQRDSTGNIDPNMFNAALWNGREWNLLRVDVKLTYIGSSDITNQDPLITVFSFGSKDIWFASKSGGVTQLKNDQWIMLDIPFNKGPGAVSGMWGRNNNDIYFSGKGGRIVYFNGSDWMQLESGTTTNINDIYGINKNGREEVYCAITNFFEPKDKKILRITNTTQVDSIEWTPERNVNSVWTADGSFLYAGGEGLFENSSGEWKEIRYGASKYIHHIRGSSANNIFVVGDVGLIAHYNGSTWKIFPFDSNISFGSIAVTNNLVIAVGVNGVVVGKRKNKF
ncbi:MAG: hypothetical protein WCT99_03590 [Bacteroidota bacterium]